MALAAVGIVGTGEIGWRIGRLLVQAGHAVVGFDVRPEALERARGVGVVPVGSAAEVAERADIVITCVPDGAALREVILGPRGLLPKLTPGKTVIDTTSAEPWISIDLARRLGEHGVDFLDAPVSGGVPAAEEGRMNFMVGGPREVLDRWRPLLARLGPTIAHVGPNGAGHAMKAVNMLALAGSLLAAAEAVALAESAGIAAARAVEILNGGLGASYGTRVHFPRFILPGTYDSGFTFDLMLKDLSIAIGLADRHDVTLFAGAAAWGLYRAAARDGLRGRDNTRIVEYLICRSPIGETEAAREPVERALVALTVAVNTVIGAEALLLGVKAGLAPATVVEVLNAGSGASAVLAEQFDRRVLSGTLDSGTCLAAARLAAVPALALAVERAVPTPVASAVFPVYAAAERRFGPGADALTVVRLLETWMGSRLRAERTSS